MKTLTRILSIVLGVALIVTGIICIVNPDVTSMTLGWFVGICMIVVSIVNIFTWNTRKNIGTADGWTLAGSIISLVFGIFIISSEIAQFATNLFIAYSIGIWILVIGILHIVAAVRLRQVKLLSGATIGNSWWIALIKGIILTVVGILGLMNPGITMIALGTFIGIEIVASGISSIMAAFEV